MNKTINLILIFILVLSSCHHQEEHEHESTKYPVSTPLVLDTVIAKDYVCQIHAYQHIELRALEKGYLQNIYVDEGQLVQEGKQMFKIMPNIYSAELQKAKAEEHLAEIEYNNTKALADNNVVSQNELAIAGAKLEKAKAEVTLASTHLNFTDIRAPFTGIMDHLHVRKGSLLNEGELLTTLSDNSKMWVYFNVPEAEYLTYEGMPKDQRPKEVSLIMANNKEFDQKGIIETIEADFDNSTGNIAFRATFPNPKGLLRHGETGSIIIKTPLKNALVIPQKSTFEILDKNYVFVLDENNVLHTRKITIAYELPHIFVIKDGLKASDKILIEGLRMVKDGDKINAELVKPESVISNLDLYAE